MSRPILTQSQIVTGLARLGARLTLDGSPSLCPACGEKSLTVHENGNGYEPLCATGGCAGPPVLMIASMAEHKVVGEPLDQVRDGLELPEIARVVKHGRGHAYVLHLENGTQVDLGSTADLFVRRRMEAAILATARHMIPAAPAAKHRELVKRIEQAAEQIDNVLSAEEETLGLIAEFTHARRATRNVDLNDKHELYGVLEEGYPFYDLDGRLYLRLEDLTGWLNRMSGQRFTRQELSGRLARIGFTKPDDGGQLAARRGDKTRSRRLWISPPNFEARL